MIKSKEFINMLTKALNSNTVYASGMWGQPITEAIIVQKAKQYPDFYDYNTVSKLKSLIGKNYFGFDCICLVKGILWGWNGNISHSQGGANYGSNGVPDVTEDGMLNKCSNVTEDFSKIVPGAYLWTEGHCGIYIGNGEVIECTTKWDSKVQKTMIDNLDKKGDKVRHWKKWGKLPYVDYTDQIIKKPKYVGHLDTVSEKQLTGWAWNSVDDSAVRVDFHIYNGNKLVKTFYTTANQYREDLKNAGVGNGRHGFVALFDFNTLGIGTYTVKAFANAVQLSNVRKVTVAPKTTAKTYSVGAEIKLKANATYFNGEPIPQWVKNKKLYYRGRNANGIKFSIFKHIGTTGVVKESSLM